MSEILTKEEREYMRSLTEDAIERTKKVKEYPYVFPEEINKALETVEVKKCIEVLKYIIDQHSNPDVYNVLKMLYLADRVHLLKYGKLITPDKYVKLQYGPVPSLCLSIIQFVRGDKYLYYYEYDEAIKEEFKVLENNRLENLKPPDTNYLSDSSKECLNAIIDKYGEYGFNELKEECHDKIYHSVPNFNDQITISDMLNVFKNDKDFVEHCLDVFNN